MLAHNIKYFVPVLRAVSCNKNQYEDIFDLEISEVDEDLADGIAAPEPKICCDPVVATSGSLQLLGRLTDHFNQSCLDVHVHILSILPPIKFAILD